jgi:hypothetical protein
MEEKSQFDKLYDAIVSPDNQTEMLSEAIFSKKTNPAKTKHPNKQKRRKNETDKKIRRAKKDRPIEKERRDMKMSRNAKSKRQSFISAYRHQKSSNDLPMSKKILNIAKKASSGIWKLSKRQVLEIAGKYHFNVPGPTRKTRHLGSTGIIMWRKSPNDYYLVKLNKHQRDGTRRT